MEKLIFEGLIHNQKYMTKVFPFIKPEYFKEQKDRVVFDLILSYHTKYGVLPDKETLVMDLAEQKGLPESTFKDAYDTVTELADTCEHNLDWLVDKTETFCKDRAIYNAVSDSLRILDDADKSRDRGSIPHLLSTALAVTFDSSVGLAYDMSIDALYEYYHTEEAKIPFGLEILDRITKGGLRKKTLTIFMAPTGGGKTIMMCHLAAMKMMEGRKVLYISAEMSEEMITHRIDANLMDLPLEQIETMGYDEYSAKKRDVLRRCRGRLVVKAYPTSAASINHFRALLEELKIKQNFVPDIVMIDYLNICASSRLKASDAGSHQYPKAIAEEVRSLAVEYDFAAVSATQMNRAGYGAPDPDLTHTSESMGLPVTADMFFGITTSDEMEQMGQIKITQLKNRFGDITNPRSFALGLDRSKMRFYDVEGHAQNDIMQPNGGMGLNGNRSNNGNRKPGGFT